MTKAAFLIGSGGPENKEQIRAFLDDLFAGSPVLPGRYEEEVRRYDLAGGSSPYNRLTHELGRRLSRRFSDDGHDVPVYVGFRYAVPGIGEVMKRMAAEGVTEVVGVVLSSFRSEPSWDRYAKSADAARAAVPGAPVLRYLRPWSDDALFLRAIANSIREGESSIPEACRGDAHWIFTAHSIPVADDHASRYADQVRRAVQRVSDDAGHVNWTLCFQSRGGRPEDPWLAPDVGEAIASLSLARSLECLMIPVGFLLDHMEILYDLDVKARRAAEGAGLAYHRAPTVGHHPAFLDLLNLRIRHVFGEMV
jgi:ferrochelatase